MVVRSGRQRRQLQPELHREVQPAQQQMGGGLLHVHAAQQCGRGRARATELPSAIFTHALCVLHQSLTRGPCLADLGLCCYCPDWLWEETQLLGLVIRLGLLQAEVWRLQRVQAEKGKVHLVQSGTFGEDRKPSYMN